MNSPKCKVCDDKECQCLKKKVDDDVKADCPMYKSDQLIIISEDMGTALRCQFPSGRETSVVVRHYGVYDNYSGKKAECKVLPNYDEMMAYKLLKLLPSKESMFFIRSNIENFSTINRFNLTLKKIDDLFEVTDIKLIKVIAPYVYCSQCTKCITCGNVSNHRKKCTKCNSHVVKPYQKGRDVQICDCCGKKMIRNKKLPKYEFKIKVLRRKTIKDVLENNG